MRTLLASTALAMVLAFSNGAPVLAQAQGDTPASTQPDMKQGDMSMQGLAASLQQATDRLRESQQGGSATQEAQDQAREVLQQIQLATGSLPEDQRTKIEQPLTKAQQSLDGQDSQSTVQAMDDLQREMESITQMAGTSGTPAEGASSESGSAAPQVMVDQAQPQVNVEQPQAQVQVEQPAPQVTVTQPQPQVTVEQPQPQVTINQPEPEVTVDQPKPQVTVNQAEPEVTVEQQGQAQVEVEQPAQPEVKVESEQPPAGTATTTDVEQAQGSTSDPNAGAQTVVDQAATATPDNPLYQKPAQDVIGQTVYGANGENVGEIDDMVRSRQGNIIAAIVGVGGFLGLGEHDVAIPLDQLNLAGDRITTAMTKEQLEALPEYDENAYEAVGRDQPLSSFHTGG